MQSRPMLQASQLENRNRNGLKLGKDKALEPKVLCPRYFSFSKPPNVHSHSTFFRSDFI